MLCSQSITVLKSQSRYVYMYRHIQEYAGGMIRDRNGRRGAAGSLLQADGPAPLSGARHPKGFHVSCSDFAGMVALRTLVLRLER